EAISRDVVGADNSPDGCAIATSSAEAEFRRICIRLGSARLSRTKAGWPLRWSSGNRNPSNVGAGRKAGRGDFDECGGGRRVRVTSVSHSGSLPQCKRERLDRSLKGGEGRGITRSGGDHQEEGREPCHGFEARIIR